MQADATPAPDPQPPARGRQVVLWAPKGGTGTTTIAANLAAAACEHGLRVAYADLDTAWGDGATYFTDLETRPGPGTAAARHPCGLRGFAATDTESVEALADGLRTGHDLVVLDSPSGVAPPAGRDLLLLVVGLDLLSLRRCRRAVDDGVVGSGPVELVCVDRNGSVVTVEDCESVLDSSCLARFCHEPALVGAGDRGVFVYGLRRMCWSAEVRRLAAVVCAGLEVRGARP